MLAQKKTKTSTIENNATRNGENGLAGKGLSGQVRNGGGWVVSSGDRKSEQKIGKIERDQSLCVHTDDVDGKNDVGEQDDRLERVGGRGGG